jgi:hypothetical protein
VLCVVFSPVTGGIPRSYIAKIMTYLFSTVKKKVTKEALAELHDFGTRCVR